MINAIRGSKSFEVICSSTSDGADLCAFMALGVVHLMLKTPGGGSNARNLRYSEVGILLELAHLSKTL